jgi:trigger factor
VGGLALTDLGEKLSGAKAGDTVRLTTTAPDSHPNENWQGKELTVELTVEQVRKQVLPEVNEEFAENIGFDSVDDLKEHIRHMLEGQVAQEAQQRMQEQVRKYLVENTEMDVPEGAASRHAQRVLQRQYIQLLQMGMPGELIEERMTEMQASAAEQAAEELKLQFILGKIIDEKDIDVSDADVNSRIAQMAVYQGRRPERLRQEMASDGSLENLREQMREQVALEEILSKAEVVEVDSNAEASGPADEAGAADSSEEPAGNEQE